MDVLAIYLAPGFITDNLKLNLVQIPEYLDREEDVQEWAVTWINRNYPIHKPAQVNGANSGSFWAEIDNSEYSSAKYGWTLIPIIKE